MIDHDAIYKAECHAAWLRHYATEEELRLILGDSWAICRNIPANRERYAKCITYKQYSAARDRAIAARSLP